jgi:hypothetical protein
MWSMVKGKFEKTFYMGRHYNFIIFTMTTLTTLTKDKIYNNINKLENIFWSGVRIFTLTVP